MNISMQALNMKLLILLEKKIIFSSFRSKIKDNFALWVLFLVRSSENQFIEFRLRASVVKA